MIYQVGGDDTKSLTEADLAANVHLLHDRHEIRVAHPAVLDQASLGLKGEKILEVFEDRLAAAFITTDVDVEGEWFAQALGEPDRRNRLEQLVFEWADRTEATDLDFVAVVRVLGRGVVIDRVEVRKKANVLRNIDLVAENVVVPGVAVLKKQVERREHLMGVGVDENVGAVVEVALDPIGEISFERSERRITVKTHHPLHFGMKPS